MFGKNVLITGVEENWKVMENIKQLKPAGIDIHISSKEGWVRKLLPDFKYFDSFSNKESEEGYISNLIAYCTSQKIGWIIPLSEQEASTLSKNKLKMRENNVTSITSFDLDKAILHDSFSVQGNTFTFSFDQIKKEYECVKLGKIDAYVDYRSDEVICCFMREEYQRYQDTVLSYEVFSNSVLKQCVAIIAQRLNIKGSFSLDYQRDSEDMYTITRIECFMTHSTREAILSDYDFANYLWSNIQGIVLLKESNDKSPFVYRLNEEYFLF
ncbi:hypothetical protein [Exiguobacterium sp. S22-S28]|uniref:hypothetical protein n=1 Tax=Exiguobacterium TaxID=33986 RepID=UPI00372D85FF